MPTYDEGMNRGGRVLGDTAKNVYNHYLEMSMVSSFQPVPQMAALPPHWICAQWSVPQGTLLFDDAAFFVSTFPSDNRPFYGASSEQRPL